MAAKTTVKLKWYGEKVYADALKQLKINGEGTGMWVHSKITKSISRDQPIKSVGKNRRKVGLNPSKPGRPPKVLHGTLRESLDYRVDVRKNGVDVYIGANTPYARALELGYKPRNLAPRPFLRPGLTKNRKGIIKRMTKKMFQAKKRRPKK